MNINLVILRSDTAGKQLVWFIAENCVSWSRGTSISAMLQRWRFFDELTNLWSYPRIQRFPWTNHSVRARFGYGLHVVGSIPTDFNHFCPWVQPLRLFFLYLFIVRSRRCFERKTNRENVLLSLHGFSMTKNQTFQFQSGLLTQMHRVANFWIFKRRLKW